MKKTIFICVLIMIFSVSIVTVIDVINAANATNIEIDIPENATDSERFKIEYEFWNNRNDGYGNEARIVSIDENNPIIYSTIDEILEKIELQETFYVYFAYSSCPWCRSSIEILLSCALDCDIEEIFYVDISNLRDVYVYEDDELVLLYEASNDYYDLLSELNNVLTDYCILDDHDNEVYVGEKRIYAPNLISISEGNAIALASSSELQSNAYEELSSEIKDDLINMYINLFKSIS